MLASSRRSARDLGPIAAAEQGRPPGDRLLGEAEGQLGEGLLLLWAEEEHQVVLAEQFDRVLAVDQLTPVGQADQEGADLAVGLGVGPATAGGSWLVGHRRGPRALPEEGGPPGPQVVGHLRAGLGRTPLRRDRWFHRSCPLLRSRVSTTSCWW